VEQPVTAFHCAVVGAGPAGLGTAAMLGRQGVETIVVDRAPHLASSWRSRYDGFRLNTSSWFSYLPGQRFPRAAGRWPSRDAVVAYYERYARNNRLRFQLHTVVERVERAPSGWTLRTSRGELHAEYVVVATGKYHTAVIPPWEGKDEYPGELVHSSAYRNPPRSWAALSWWSAPATPASRSPANWLPAARHTRGFPSELHLM
jgi:putative flavoprotein involved in K+ transport